MRTIFGPRPGCALLAAVSMLGLLLCGCSGNGNRKPVYAVKGRVLYQGRPAPHALVVLHPLTDADRDMPRPRGQVGADGSFTLTTYDTNDGAPEGEYAVTIERWLSTASRRSVEGDNRPPLNRLPSRYSRLRTSGLRVTIRQGDNQLPDFQLKN